MAKFFFRKMHTWHSSCDTISWQTSFSEFSSPNDFSFTSMAQLLCLIGCHSKCITFYSIDFPHGMKATEWRKMCFIINRKGRLHYLKIVAIRQCLRVFRCFLCYGAQRYSKLELSCHKIFYYCAQWNFKYALFLISTSIIFWMFRFVIVNHSNRNCFWASNAIREQQHFDCKLIKSNLTMIFMNFRVKWKKKTHSNEIVETHRLKYCISVNVEITFNESIVFNLFVCRDFK